MLKGDSSFEGTQPTTNSLSDVLKLTQVSQNRKVPAIKSLTRKFTQPPECFGSNSDYFDAVDECAIRAIHEGEHTDIGIWERTGEILQERYGVGVAIHVCRKRLWNLRLRLVLMREKGDKPSYVLHPKWERKIKEAITHG